MEPPDLLPVPPLHGCASLEGRANLLDGDAAASCAALSADSCARAYSTDAQRQIFRLCEPSTLAAGGGGCVDGPALECGVASGLARLRALRRALALRIAALASAALSCAEA